MIRQLPNALLWCTLWSVVGCDGELASDFTIHLVPHTLTGQEPFKDGREVELIAIDPEGVVEVHYAGAVQGGQVSVEELPPIAAGTTLGVLIEEPGGTNGQIDIDLAAAWGSAELPEKAELGGQRIDVDVMIAEIATVGDMGSLSGNRRSLGAGVAMIPGGDVYLFGGAPGTGDADVPTDRILRMTDTDLGTWNFDKIDTSLTARDGVEGWFGVTATPFTDDDGIIKVFVQGGRAEIGGLPGTPTRAAYLFDPVEQDWIWGHKDAHSTPIVPRSESKHILMDNNRIVIYGGWTSSLGNATIEIFNPKNKTFEFVDNVVHGSAQPAGTTMGPAGALICGGGELNGGGPTITTPTAACDTITIGGVISSSADMPVPVLGHAMARLADGTILATGGIVDPVDDNASVPATNEAWLYNGGTWTPAPDTMRHPRAHHAIIPMPDGNAIIIGGAEEGGAVFHNGSPAVVCPELYNAGSKTFSDIQPCSAAGAGVYPGVSAVNAEGAFILAGEDSAETTPNGDDYGFIAFPPDLD